MEENIETLQKSGRVIQPPAKIKTQAYIQDYEKAYKESIADPEKFWEGIAKELHWFSPWNKVLEWNYPWAKWFLGGTCNISYNCLDRHVNSWRKNKVAVIWVGEEGEERIYTYAELYRQVNKCANALKSLGMKQGDRVTIYPAQDSRANCRHARLRTPWPYPFGRLLRVQCRQHSNHAFKMPKLGWSSLPMSGMTAQKSFRSNP